MTAVEAVLVWVIVGLAMREVYLAGVAKGRADATEEIANTLRAPSQPKET